MAIWIIEAVVSADDPAWMGRSKWQSVIARAPSAARARLVAGSLEPPRSVGNESAAHRTCFDDEKLYWVRQIDPKHWDEDGKDEVLAIRTFRE